MSRFSNDDVTAVKIGEPIIFENKVGSNYDVSAGIIFHKSGLYEVLITENKTIVSKVGDLSNGKWEDEGWYADGHDHHVYSCPTCAKCFIKCPDEIEEFNFCPNCGTKMEGVR